MGLRLSNPFHRSPVVSEEGQAKDKEILKFYAKIRAGPPSGSENFGNFLVYRRSHPGAPNSLVSKYYFASYGGSIVKVPKSK